MVWGAITSTTTTSLPTITSSSSNSSDHSSRRIWGARASARPTRRPPASSPARVASSWASPSTPLWVTSGNGPYRRRVGTRSAPPHRRGSSAHGRRHPLCLRRRPHQLIRFACSSPLAKFPRRGCFIPKTRECLRRGPGHGRRCTSSGGRDHRSRRPGLVHPRRRSDLFTGPHPPPPPALHCRRALCPT